MKKFLASALCAVLLLGVLASCASGGDTTEAMKNYEQEKDYLIDEAGNVFYFEEAEGDTAILTKYTGKATTNDRVTIPEMFGDRVVTAIGNEAFYNLAAVVEVNIPDTVTRIGSYAFSRCTELTTINLPAGVISIGKAAFYGCTKLETVNDAEHPLTALETIGENAFRECAALKTINGGALPETLKVISDGAFWGCTSLTSVEFPLSVEEIGGLAYYNCTGLTSIKLHNNFEEGSLGAHIFTTATSTLKDRIDLTGITNEYVLQYVAAIIEPAGSEEAESNSAESGDAESSDAESNPTESGDAESNPAESEDAESGDAESNSAA